MSKTFRITLGLVIVLTVFGGSLFAMGKIGNAPKSGTARATGQAEESSGSAKRAREIPGGILVTFVELGSVNCIPCKMMQPVMEEIEKEYGTQVKVVFHDVWTEAGRPFAEKYQIRGIPTQVFLDKNGNEFFRHMGFYPKEEIVKVLKTQGVK